MSFFFRKLFIAIEKCESCSYIEVFRNDWDTSGDISRDEL